MLLTNSILAACASPPEVSLTPAAIATAAPSNSAQPTSAATVADTAIDAPTSTTEPTGETAIETVAVETADIEFPGEGATLLGTFSKPAGDGPFPVILVCHENRGLTEHIKDVTRRLAQAGYVALAVDLLSRQGGTSELSSDQVPGILGNTPPDQFVSDFRSGYNYLMTVPGAEAERLGMVGFCFGGGVTWLMATRMPELRAAVLFTARTRGRGGAEHPGSGAGDLRRQ
jgi:carboxymethylenebutenolidase